MYFLQNFYIVYYILYFYIVDILLLLWNIMWGIWYFLFLFVFQFISSNVLGNRFAQVSWMLLFGDRSSIIPATIILLSVLFQFSFSMSDTCVSWNIEGFACLLISWNTLGPLFLVNCYSLGKDLLNVQRKYFCAFSFLCFVVKEFKI